MTRRHRALVGVIGGIRPGGRGKRVSMNIIARTVVVAAAAVAVLAPAAGYRGVYRIDDAERVVHVVRIDHRADVCRT